MTVFVARSDGKTVVLLARAESPEVVGDARVEVRPGQSSFGRPHAWWEARPGAVEIGGDGIAVEPPARD